jgi:hypothetical protein
MKHLTQPDTLVCDRCGREMRANAPDFEHQERLAIRFRAGVDSVFSDGALVESDLCQHCVREVLGPWLRVTPDDPREPRHRLDGGPRRAYQEYQLPGTGREAGPEISGQPDWPAAGE